MKLMVQLFLFAFMFFLSAPTLVSLVDNEEDIACFYNFAEEEVEKEVSTEEGKLKQEALLFNFTYFFDKAQSSLIFKNLSVLGYQNLAHQIFAPPPNNLKYLS